MVCIPAHTLNTARPFNSGWRGCTPEQAAPRPRSWQGVSSRHPSSAARKRCARCAQQDLDGEVAGAMAGVAHLGFVAVGDEVDRLRVEVVGVLVHQLRGDRRRRTLREVCARTTKSPVAHSQKIQGILLVLPSAAARVWVGVRTELRDEGEEEHDAVAVRRQPRLHRMACEQPTPTRLEYSR